MTLYRQRMRPPQHWRRRMALAATLLLGACSGHEAPPAQPLAADAPAPDLHCESDGNCVNSLPGSDLLPLRYSGAPTQGMLQLQATLAALPEASITRQNAHVVETIFTTLLGFRDEVIFVVAPEGGLVHFRSRSLVGRYDFGKNRSRMQSFAERFKQQVSTP